VSKQSGIDFNKMAMDLATRRAFTMDDRVKVSIMNRIMLGFSAAGMFSGRPGVGIAAALTAPVTAHAVSKVVAPLQGLAGPGGVTLYEYLKNQYPVDRMPPPLPIKDTESQSYRVIRVGDKRAASERFIRAMRSGAGREF
jgi:hypothetical protein